MRPPQPGINGVRYAARTNYLYYTSTAYQLFMRVPVGSMWDDFTIDERRRVAYITTHRQNTIERVPLDPGSGQAPRTAAGQPFDPRLVGPSSVAWGRRPGEYGRIAYVTTDGGLVAPPPDGIVRPAKLLRAELF